MTTNVRARGVRMTIFRGNPRVLSRVLVGAAAAALCGLAKAQTICSQPGISCVSAQYTPWRYLAYFSSNNATGKWYDSPQAALDDLTALIKSEFCTVGGGAMSGFSPGGAPGYLADSQEFATAQYQTSFLAPTDPKCGHDPTGTSTGYISGYRQVTCPRGYTYQYYPSDGSVCWQRSSSLSLAISGTKPTIPPSSGVVQGKVLTTSNLSLALQQNGQAAGGKQVHLASDRGMADQISPSQPLTTDATGKASAKVSTRTQPGTSSIRATDSDISTATPGVVGWLPAQYEDSFLITCYTIASEADAAATPVSKKEPT